MTLLRYKIYIFLNHLTISGCNYILSFELLSFFQSIVFGDNGQRGHLVQNLVVVELILDHVARLKLNEMVEGVQVPEVTVNLAIHNLVQVSKL